MIAIDRFKSKNHAPTYVIENGTILSATYHIDGDTTVARIEYVLSKKMRHRVTATLEN